MRTNGRVSSNHGALLEPMHISRGYGEVLPLRRVQGTELRTMVSFVLGTLVSQSCWVREVVFMNNIIYIVGAVVIVLVILSFVGLV
ncbi:hypothetical protein J3D54_004270 [Pseudomonas sp. GGS8]|nr:hypothetical protein [Pseudomonas sp. GGS8]